MTTPASLFNEEDSDSGGWFSGVEGIVANVDDTENQHRVQCVIPIINEDEIYPVWARRICFFVGSPGYGEFHPPTKGTEVVLFGRFGDSNSLFYAPIYNENFPVPTDFRSLAVRGVRIDADYKIITEGNLILRAGKIIIEADSSVIIIGPGGVFQKTGSEG